MTMLISVDVEADGPCPGLYSMVSFGAVSVLDTTRRFKGLTAPISPTWIPDALAISGVSRDEHKTYPEPSIAMRGFASWITEVCGKHRPVFISDNPAFDWQFINYYFHKYIGQNPFGYSARRIGDLYCGLKKDGRARWKHLRRTKHDHDPVNDALSNAEAILEVAKEVKHLL